jgi:hypothetical protein
MRGPTRSRRLGRLRRLVTDLRGPPRQSRGCFGQGRRHTPAAAGAATASRDEAPDRSDVPALLPFDGSSSHGALGATFLPPIGGGPLTYFSGGHPLVRLGSCDDLGRGRSRGNRRRSHLLPGPRSPRRPTYATVPNCASASVPTLRSTSSRRPRFCLASNSLARGFEDAARPLWAGAVRSPATSAGVSARRLR